jgi:ATP-dependent Lon protease
MLNVENPSVLTDLVASHLSISLAEKEETLETVDLRKRMEKITRFLNREFETLELSQKIQSQIKEGMDKTHREYYLREQLKAIQKELGQEDEHTVEIQELRKRLAESNLPEEAYQAATRELDRLSRMPPAAAEYTVARTYLDWLLDLPWSISTPDSLDIRAAKEVLDEDHFDLEKVKKRILEYLAVRKLKTDMKGPILCLAGPPGVGKTSLGRSIARALGRKFVRISLGGVRDEAEIRGHRRTYVGALPGRIIQGLKKAGSNNPVFMLDEVDKIGADFRGDPAAALLEVLDPEQNFSFSDHYLDVPFDLSRVMFITTANILETIPPALRDRMEVLSLPGYTEEEKIAIAKTHLIPKQITEHGLESGQISFTDDTIRLIITSYTRESGLRNLDREIATICRGIARKVTEGDTTPVVITPEMVATFLGPIRYFAEVAERTATPGVATGMAWTPAGGEIIFVEVTKMPGRNNLILTGQLGEVMKESAQAALSYVRSHAEELGIARDFYEKLDLHIHVPAGAIPKDGPSAGVTILTALISLLTGRPVRSDVAMTGEITLQGLVLPVGGIKEKVLAARRAGIHVVILPEKSRKDLEDIPEEMRRDLEFHFVPHVDEIIQLALPVCAQEGEEVEMLQG